MKKTPGSTFGQHPTSRTGWQAVGLTAAFSIMFIVNSSVFTRLSEDTQDGWWVQALLPVYGWLLVLVGLAAGIMGLVAILKKGERSWLIWVTLLPSVFILLMLLGALVSP